MEELLTQQVFHGAPVDLADGFIHLSTDEQLRGTLDKHFTGQENLYLARIDLAALGSDVRWEPARGGALFPHIYGPMPLTAVIMHGHVQRREDGSVLLPDQA
ncbi:MAG: hypothetical protein APF82_03440 [Sphingomonadales bacterium BRH_c42]|nr:MAG: hypothetical protein APF82_03440 [Sphingomonadales bacterium BRH_c42]